MTKLEVRKLADFDIETAEAWYRKESPNRADGVALAVAKTVRGILRNPRLARIRYRNIRMVSVTNYPYQIWYRYNQNKNIVTVVRILHERSNRSEELKHQ